MTDQNGTQHNYTLDDLGRQVSDTATVLGADVYGGTGNPAVAGDPAVRRIDTAYDLLGNVVAHDQLQQHERRHVQHR